MPASSQYPPVPGTERGRAAVDFAIAGGGIVGLTTALMLREAGASVAVYDRAPGPGRESSGAAGGMLTLLYPWEHPGPLEALVQYSRGAWPGLCERISESSGLDTGFDRCGLVTFDLDGLDAARDWAAWRGEALVELDATALARRVPSADAGLGAAIELPGVDILNPRYTLAALASTLSAEGVALHWSTPVAGVVIDSGRVLGVRTGSGDVHPAGAVVVATGAWSPQLLAPLGLHAPVRPVRGQMVELDGPPGLLNAVLVRDHTYMIARADGGILVGSTVEEAGFDKSVTAEAAGMLRAAAAAMVPATGAMAQRGHWAGLRPGSPHGIPAIGRVPGVPGLWLNAGHFRNGVTLAAGSAALLGALAAGTPPPLDPDPYDPAAHVTLDKVQSRAYTGRR